MPAPEVVKDLETRFGGAVRALGVAVPPAVLREAALRLRDLHGYRYYLLASAICRPGALEVVHGVRNLDTGDTVFLAATVPDGAAELDSLVPIYPGADWHEREVYDLFGVVFRDHPDLRRILLPDDYEGHPLRKEFPLDAPWGYRPPSGEGSP